MGLTYIPPSPFVPRARGGVSTGLAPSHSDAASQHEPLRQRERKGLRFAYGGSARQPVLGQGGHDLPPTARRPRRTSRWLFVAGEAPARPVPLPPPSAPSLAHRDPSCVQAPPIRVHTPLSSQQREALDAGRWVLGPGTQAAGLSPSPHKTHGGVTAHDRSVPGFQRTGGSCFP